MAFSTILIFIFLTSVTIINCELTLKEITHKVHQQVAASRISGRGSLQAEAARLLDEPEAVGELAEAMSSLPYYLHRSLSNTSNTSSPCSIAWKSLSARTQKLSLKPIMNITMAVSKETIALDACGKPVPEILKGNTQFRGGFDECMSIDTSNHNFSMKYSVAPIVFVYIKGADVTVFPVPLMESLCIPDTCTLADINATLTNINNAILSIPVVPNKVLLYVFPPFQTMGSQTDIPLRFSTGAIVMIAVCFLFVFAAIIGTAYDIITPYYVAFSKNGLVVDINDSSDESIYKRTAPLLGKPPDKETASRSKVLLQDVFESFSLYKTIPAILSTVQPPSAITSINGLRVISMFWVILGHTYYFLLPFQAYKNQIDLFQDFVTRFSAQSIVNAYFAVDSFFFLSGLLVAYLTFREMSRKNGRFPYLSFYLHRIFRLTPTYMFVLFFYWFLAVHITDGPELRTALGEESDGYKNCEKYWWTNLLYINNFYPVQFGKQCMGWAWYLANDMQFYVISPLILIPLFMSLPSGLIALGIPLIASLGMSGFVAGYYGYPANQFSNAINEVKVDPDLPDQSTEIYGKPYTRITPYLVGIFLGYVLYKKYQINFRNVFARISFAGAIWAVAITLGIANVYGLYSSFNGHEFTPTENVLYFMLSRFTWGVTLFLVVYVCHNGYGGVINSFLSLPIWVPLGRVTFTAYLVHEVVLLILLSEMRDGIYFTDMTLVVHIIANTVISFGAAFVISVFVEFPMSNIERSIFKFFGKPLRATTRAGNDKE